MTYLKHMKIKDKVTNLRHLLQAKFQVDPITESGDIQPARFDDTQTNCLPSPHPTYYIRSSVRPNFRFQIRCSFGQNEVSAAI